MTRMTLLLPIEVDGLLRYRAGRSRQLAKRGKLPHLVLPDGEIRFVEEEITNMLRNPGVDPMRIVPVEDRHDGGRRPAA
jgi:hypothetical protein